MKRHFSVLVCLVLALAFAFSLASCNKNPEPEHKHNFVEGKCECGSTDPNYTAPHVHNFKDGQCAACGTVDPDYVVPHVHKFVFGSCVCGATDPNYVEPHTHTYADVLTAGETTHWYAANCEAEEGCATAKKDEAAHEYVDGVCVCGATDPNYVAPHTHTYADVLTAGETTHWYAANCEADASCATAKKDEAAHEYVDGVCVCGAEEPYTGPDGSAEKPFEATVPGTLEIAYAGGSDIVWYTFTASATKKLDVTLSSANANMAYGISTTSGLTYTKGATSVRVELVEGTTYYIGFCTMNEEAETFTVTAEYVVSPYEAVIVVGSNNVYLSPEEVAANEASKKLVITEAGEYKIGSGSLWMNMLLDAAGNAVAKGTDNPTHPYYLVPGEYTVHFANLQMFGAASDTAYTVTVEKYVAPEGYIFIGKVNGADASFSYTADAEGIILIEVENATGGAVDIVTYAINGGEAITASAMGASHIYVKLNAGDTVVVNVTADEGATARIAGQWTDADLDPEDAVTDFEGTGTSADPIVITGEGTYVISDVNNWPGKYITYTATSNVTVVFTADVPSLWGNGYTGSAAQTVKKASLIVGESVTFIACMDYGVCDVIITVTTEEYIPESDDELKVGETADVFVDKESETNVTFTVTKEGTYIITVLTENGQLLDSRFGTVLDNPLTVTFTAADLADFEGSYTIYYKVATSDGKAGYVRIKVEEKVAEEPSDDPITGTGSEMDPFVVAGEGSVIISAGKYQPVFVTVPAGFTASLDCDAQFYAESDPMTPLGTSVTPAVDTLYLIFANTEAGCMGQLTTTVAQGGGETPEAPEIGTGSGTDSDPYVIADTGDFTCEFPGGYDVVWYGFTATQNGTIVLSTTFGANGWLKLGANTMIAISNDGTGASLSMAVVAGQFYYAGVGDWGEGANTVPFSLAYSEGEEEGGDDDITVSGSIWDGMENEIEVSAEQYEAGKVYYTFCPDYTGEYAFASDLYVSSVIDAQGNVLERNENWYFELIAYEVYTLELSFDWIESEGTYTFEAMYQYPAGHEKNPFVIDFDYVYGDTITANYAGNWNTVWYSIYVSDNGILNITAANPNVTILVKVNGATAKEYEGVASLGVIKGREYLIGIADFTEDPDTYQNPAAMIDFSLEIVEGEYVADGTAILPEIITEGDTTIELEAWAEPYYFAYVATGNGTLKVTTTSTNCSWSVLADLTQLEWVDNEPFELDVYEGYIVYIVVSTADTITFNVSLEAAPEEVWFYGNVALDGTANNFEIVDDNSYIGFNWPWNATGEYVIAWDNVDAIIEANGVAVVNGDTLTVDNPYDAPTFYVYFAGYTTGTVNVTFTSTAPTAIQMQIGDNTVTVYDSYKGQAVTLPTSDADVTYLLTVGANAVVDYNNNFYDVEGTVIEIVVPADETVTVKIINMYAADANAVVNLAVKEDVEEPELPENPGTTEPAGSGTAADPYVVTSLPTVFDFPGSHDVFVKFVATEDCSIVITYTAGCYVDGLPSFLTMDSFTKTVTGDLTAGQSFTLNLWNLSSGGKYTYAIAGAELPGEDDNDTEEEGGTTAEPIATLTFVAPGSWKKTEEQIVVFETAGSYVIAATGFDAIVKTYLQYYDVANDTWARIDAALPLTMTFTAGQELKLRLYGWDNADTGKEIVVTVTPVA